MNKLIAVAVAAIINSGKASAKADSAGASLARTIRDLYVEVAGNEAEFIATFGDGKTGKNGIPGALAAEVREKAKKISNEADRKAILTTLKSRLTEVRRLYRAGGMPGKDETVAQAVGRYVVKKGADTAPKASAGKASAVVIPDDASMADVAEALSLWVAKHGNSGAVGLAKSLADFMPISIKRSRAA